MEFTFEVVNKETGRSYPTGDPDIDADMDFSLKPDGSLVLVDWKGRESGELNDEYEVVLHFETRTDHIAINLSNDNVKTNPLIKT